MKVISILKFSGIVFVIWAIIISCQQDTPSNDVPLNLEKPGVFVVNEGNFTFGNSSLTYYNYTNNKVTPDVFYFSNGVPLGDVANYMTLRDNKGYVVINNSGVIYAINVFTAGFLGKVAGLTSPREILFVDNNIAYVSDIVETSLTIVDFQDFSVIGNIDLDGHTSESMIKSGEKVYITNWSGQYQEKPNDVVLVVDILTNKLVDSINVTKEPNSMQVDKNDNLWVLCSGGYLNEETPALYKINTQNNEVETVYEFLDKACSPISLEINKTFDTLYFINKEIYRMSIYDDSIPEDSFINSGVMHFYALGIDKKTNYIYVSDVKNYSINGNVYIYDSEGKERSVFTAGINPGCFVFNH
jgi:hypothetical protein